MAETEKKQKHVSTGTGVRNFINISSRYVFSFYLFYFDFHSARIIFDVSSGFYLWNKYYQRNAIAASRADKQVCCMVDYFNDHLRLINRNCGTPRISQDIIASSKGARAERTSYRKNWNVYSDGIHPVRALARLWLYRVIELATEIAAKTESCG